MRHNFPEVVQPFEFSPLSDKISFSQHSSLDPPVVVGMGFPMSSSHYPLSAFTVRHPSLVQTPLE